MSPRPGPLAHDYHRAREALLGSASEKDFGATVTDMARLMGWRVFHQWASIHSEPGWPDLVLLRPPRLIFAELKTTKGRVSPQQRATLDSLLQCGEEAYVWRPGDLDEIEGLLRGPESAHEPAQDAPGAPL